MGRFGVRTADGSARQRGTIALTGALAIDTLGSGLFMPISLLYFVRVTALHLTTIGLLISLATLMTLPVPILVGHLADRLNPRDLVISGQILQAIGFAGFRAVHGPASVLAVSVLVAIGQRVFWSSFFTLVAAQARPGEDRQMADRRFALAGMVQTAGMGLGALITGLVLISASTDVYRWLTIVNAGSFALSAVILLGVRRTRAEPPGPAGTAGTSGYRAFLRDRPYQLLIVINTVFALCSVMVGLAVPIYVIDALPAPHWLVGLLLALNTILLAIGQTATVRLIRPLSRVRVMVLAGSLWTVWSAIFAFAVRVPGPILVPYLLAGMLFYIVAELIHAPISAALAASAAPEHSRGRYLAVFQYCFTVANIAAPVCFTALYSRGHALPWIVLAALAAIATAGMRTLEHRLPDEENVRDTTGAAPAILG